MYEVALDTISLYTVNLIFKLSYSLTAFLCSRLLNVLSSDSAFLVFKSSSRRCMSLKKHHQFQSQCQFEELHKVLVLLFLNHR